MPLDLQARLELAKTDPNMVSYIFGGVELSQNSRYLTDRLAGDCDKYSEMLLEPQISGPLGERVGALLGRRVIVEPASIRQIDRDAADTAQRIIDFNVVPYEKICKNFLLTGLIFDFAVQAVVDVEQREVIYPVTKTDAQGNETQEVAKQTLIVPRLEFVPQRRFTFRYFEPENAEIYVCTDEDLKPEDIALVDGYELRLLTKRSPINGERCPKDRFFTYSCDGIGAQIRKFYEIRKEVLKSGVLTGDRLGSPPTHGTYPADLDTKDPEQAAVLAAFNRLLRAISPNAHASTTEGFKISFLEASKSGGHEILKWLYDTAGVEITRAIWGQGSHADKDTGSYGAEVQQAQNRNENVVDGDCNSQDEQLAPQFWEWIRKYNYAKANAPIVRRETFADRRKAEQEKAKEEYRSSRVQTDMILINTIGLSVTQEYITETYGPEFTLPAAEPAPAPETTDLSEADFAAHVDRYLDWNDLRLGVRNRPGETRFPQYRTAKKLQSAYGFVQGYQSGGKALRCYIHPELLKGESQSDGGLHVVMQLDRNGEPDEEKLMIGYPSTEAAELAYRREMPEWAFGGIEAIDVEDLQEFSEVDFEEGEWRIYFFKDRRTGIVARSIEEARKKLKRGGPELVKVRSLTEAERKIAARGEWVRTGPNGEPAGYPGKRGMGPEPKSYRSHAEDEPTEEELIEFADTGDRFTDEALHQKAVTEAKQKFAIYPSAYASSHITKRYKELYRQKHGSMNGAFSGSKGEGGLTQWHGDDWVRIGADGSILGDCGDRSDKESKPKCLPRAKAEAMTKQERAAAVRRKRKDDPNPDRQGEAKHVSTHAEGDPESDLLNTYEQQFAENLSNAYAETLSPIQQFIDRIANSDATDEEKYRQFSDGIYDLYEQMDAEAIATVLAEGLTAGYLAGIDSERIDNAAD